MELEQKLETDSATNLCMEERTAKDKERRPRYATPPVQLTVIGLLTGVGADVKLVAVDQSPDDGVAFHPKMEAKSAVENLWR